MTDYKKMVELAATERTPQVPARSGKSGILAD
jgi:hypothetical protein